MDRISLWSKLLNSGISGKIFTVITNIYGDTKSCVRHNNQLSELFSCVIGVRQGENLSPLLFALYLNDLRTYLSNSCPGMEIRVNSGGDTDIYMKLSVFNYNGRFNKAKAKQVAQAKWALFGLIAKARKLQLPTDIQCHLFDSCIVPVLLYGCEIWGFSDLTQIEQVQNYFCKQILM